MTNTTPQILNILAASVWIIGGIALTFKAFSLLAEARLINPGLFWPLVAVAVGLLMGGVKAKYLFSKSCKKNIARIAALEQPKLWQFFRPGFFLMLAAMITLGVTLSRLAEGNFLFLLAVAALDLTIAVALLTSSTVFWRQRAFAPALQ